MNEKTYPYLVKNYTDYLKLLNSYNKMGELDLSKYDWIPISELLLLRDIIIKAKENKVYVEPKNNDVNGYINYITKERVLEKGKPTNEGQNYLQFTRVNETNQNTISSIIVQNLGNNLTEESKTGLRYCIDELLDNVIEHSNYKNSYIMMQNYPSKKKLEFAVLDDGISIPGNFRNHKIEFDKDVDSLVMALNGTSTKNEGNNERGYGLRTSFNLLIKGMKGEGVIISGNGVLSIQFIENIQNKKIIPFNYGEDSNKTYLFRGCYIAFRVRTDLSTDLYQYIE
ncbi:MAG: hypothetical protein ACP5RS_02735 [Thermoplasmata archaeon]